LWDINWRHFFLRDYFRWSIFFHPGCEEPSHLVSKLQRRYCQRKKIARGPSIAKLFRVPWRKSCSFWQYLIWIKLWIYLLKAKMVISWSKKVSLRF
jgi:hypothetical protein